MSEEDYDKLDNFDITKVIKGHMKFDDSCYHAPNLEFPFMNPKSGRNPVVANFVQSKALLDQPHLLGLLMPVDDIQVFSLYNRKNWLKIVEQYNKVAGVYVFYGPHNQPIYIGETENFCNRFSEHIDERTNTGDIQFTNYNPARYFNKVEFYQMRLGNEADRKVIERMLFYYKKPLHNWFTENMTFPDEITCGSNYRRYLHKFNKKIRVNKFVFTARSKDLLLVHANHMKPEEFSKRHGGAEGNIANLIESLLQRLGLV